MKILRKYLKNPICIYTDTNQITQTTSVGGLVKMTRELLMQMFLIFLRLILKREEKDV